MRSHYTSLLLTVIIGLSIASGCKKNPPPSPLSTAPSIASITPSSGNAGAAVTITGSNFQVTVSDNTVKFNGVVAVVSTASATSLVVTVPAGGSTGHVTVSTSDGTATGPLFTYLANPSPTIVSITPASGAVGDTVTINGTNFKTTSSGNTVKFNGTVATVTSANSTQLLVIVPAGGTTGNITVATSDGPSNGILFTYITGPAVYLIGEQTDGQIGYWKNAGFNPLANAGSYPRAITGSGSDIYIAGPLVASVVNPNHPTYWKNGTAVQLTSAAGYTSGIFVSGTDVYCIGNIDSITSAHPSVWKNGARTEISQNYQGSVALAFGNNAVFVSNGDVYIAGIETVAGSPYYQKATYWKNGTPTYLTNGTTGNAQATAIFISGNDVYVTGVEEEKSGGGIVNKAPRLWKNGVSVPLAIPANSLYNNTTSVLVVGSDVYVGGQYNGAGALWKNSTMINTAGYALAEQVTSIFLFSNTELYVSGSSSSSGMNGYWKNGNFVEMDPGCTTASSSCAATFANQVSGIYVK